MNQPDPQMIHKMMKFMELNQFHHHLKAGQSIVLEIDDYLNIVEIRDGYPQYFIQMFHLDNVIDEGVPSDLPDIFKERNIHAQCQTLLNRVAYHFRQGDYEPNQVVRFSIPGYLTNILIFLVASEQPNSQYDIHLARIGGNHQYFIE